MMADDKITKRLDALEEETESQTCDLIITVHTEQHERVGDELIAVKREPSGYSEVHWSQPDKSGRRIGTRYAKYADDEKRGSNWTDEQLNQPSSFDPEVMGD
jgi:hypothetical protein